MTSQGEGYVLQTQSWSDELRSRDEHDAMDFIRRTSATYGSDSCKFWQNLYVSIGGRVGWIENYLVTLVEGRDIDTSSDK